MWMIPDDLYYQDNGEVSDGNDSGEKGVEYDDGEMKASMMRMLLMSVTKSSF